MKVFMSKTIAEVSRALHSYSFVKQRTKARDLDHLTWTIGRLVPQACVTFFKMSPVPPPTNPFYI